MSQNKIIATLCVHDRKKKLSRFCTSLISFSNKSRHFFQGTSINMIISSGGYSDILTETPRNATRTDKQGRIFAAYEVLHKIRNFNMRRRCKKTLHEKYNETHKLSGHYFSISAYLYFKSHTASCHKFIAD
jgi:hypothetical protein